MTETDVFDDWNRPTLRALPRDLVETALNVGLGGGLFYRFAFHVLLTAFLLDEPLTERVTATHGGATLHLGVEAGLDEWDRMLVRCGTCAILCLMAFHLLRASVITHKMGAVFLGLQILVPATDPIQEVILQYVNE